MDHSTRLSTENRPISSSNQIRSLVVTVLVIATLGAGLVAMTGAATAMPADDENATTAPAGTAADSAADAPPGPSSSGTQGIPAVTGPAAGAGIGAGIVIAIALFVRQQN